MKKSLYSILILMLLLLLNNNAKAQEKIKILKKENSKIKPLIKSFIKYKNNDIINTCVDNKNYLVKNNYKTKNTKGINNVELTLLFNLPGPYICLIKQDTFYFDKDVVFLNPYTAKLNVEAGTYKMFIGFYKDSSNQIIPSRNVFRKNVLIDSINDTLRINSSEANHIVFFKGSDNNGNLIQNSLNSYISYSFEMQMYKFSYEFFYFFYPGNGFYTTDLIDSSPLYCTENKVDVDNTIFLNLNHPQINQINQDTLELTNLPDVYTKQYVEINQPSNINNEIYWGSIPIETFNNHTMYYPIVTIKDTLTFSEQNKWLGTFYLTPDFNSHITNAIYSIYKNSNNYNIYRVVNDSVTIFGYQNPTSDLYLSSAGDTLILGKGLMFLHNIFYNENSVIDMSPQLLFQMKDNHYSEFTSSVFNLYDSTGTLIKSSNEGWIVNQKEEVPTGKYRVEFCDTSYYVSGQRGKAIMNNYFNLNLQDKQPPFLNALQIRNSNNKPVEKLNTGESATVNFSCADWHTGKYNWMYYRSILADSTKVFLKQYGTNKWSEINRKIICEDTSYNGGYYYIADIPQEFTAFDSSAIDLKIVFQDSSGNKTDYTLEPAVAVGKFKAPYYMPVTVADYYEVKPGDTLIVTNKNSVLTNDKGEAPFKLSAKLITQPHHGTIDFNPDGTFTYYTEQGYVGSDSLTYKAINGNKIYSIEQKIIIDIKRNAEISQLKKINTGLNQNFPNPFSYNTAISYVLDNNSKVELTIYNQTGQQIITLVKGYITKGKHIVTWQGTDKYGNAVPSGIYYYKLSTENKTISKSAVLIK